MDVVRVEKVEADLDSLIERRGRDEADTVEALWAESERAYHEKRQRALREQWHEWHLSMAEGLERTAADLAAEHRAKAEALLEEHDA